MAAGVSQNNKTILKEVLTSLHAVSEGDFSVRMPLDYTGLEGKVADLLNDVIEQNQQLVTELQRVGTAVGKEGKLSRRANLGRNKGTWLECVDSVNTLIDDLAQPIGVTTQIIQSVAEGDFSHQVPLQIDDRPLKGDFLKLAQLVNTTTERVSTITDELTRVAREVGSEGKLGGQADVGNVSGSWQELTESVNMMAGNLTGQVRNIAEVTTAVANGDLSKKITVNVKGEILELKDTINVMVDQLSSFASEVTRVAREVGSEGILGGQAEVDDVSGTWRDLTESVNMMAGNLTGQVRNIAEVTTAVANGDLSKKITVDVKGEILELKDTINVMVDQLSSFASEVTRVAREVGSEGILGGQAEVVGVSGTWRDLTESVNTMAGNLTGQVRNIAEVTTAVANGDLSKKITVDVKGEILELKDTINVMVDQLSSFASEVTRVAREVGTEGILGVQAEVEGVGGTWRDLTDSVNMMAGNLTDQVRNIAEVTTAVANGDLSKKITVDVKGEISELKGTINVMVDQLSAFASEVTRVAKEVGSEGKLGGQARVDDVGGTWRDLTESVNMMAGNLTSQVRNIAEVTTAVANGDLSKKITVDVKGEILELKNTINIMVDQLNAFASEVTRVAREVGSEGRLGGQAEVQGVSGTWRDLTESVNMMAGNLTSQVRNIAAVTTAVANGDLSKKITVDVRGEILELKETVNVMVDQLNAFASEVTRVAREVGSEGKLGGQAYVRGVDGTWKDLTDSVNMMAGNLTGQVRNIAEVTKAVARGDLTKKITVDVKGEILELKDTINVMVDQLSSFASEVTRVAKEVGSQGKLGGQAEVAGVAGTWKDLTDSVNMMAGNLTDQVRGIAKVVTAVAEGNLTSRLTLEAKGEIAELSDTINNMSSTLATFADQVTGVAREVGIEGKLGAQADVPGASGTWRDLTDNVNQLADNLTTQVRAIGEVTQAVTKGDLTQEVTVEAQGEVADLTESVNQMITTLRETTQQNDEQDWLKTNLAKFSRLLQGQRDLQTAAQQILSELAPLISVQHGIFYLLEESEAGVPRLKLVSTYAYQERKSLSNEFQVGEGLVGQCALEKQRILITDPPEDYIRINSGLGTASPRNIVVLPIQYEGEVAAVIELASFHRFSPIHITFLDQLTESIGVVLNSITAAMRTEELLQQSQSLTGELQQQQQQLTDKNERLEVQAKSLQESEELLKQQQQQLQITNDELQTKAQLLSEQNTEVERKNQVIEEARQALEDKAQELTQTSKYKSEFLANMSHELRTPLNSLLILAKMLGDNQTQNLTQKQVDFANTIHSAGMDLLMLINDILDLAKIESGKMSVDIQTRPIRDLKTTMERTFQQVAVDKGLEFAIEQGNTVPSDLTTDFNRLQQVLKNLLSNAFKFTEQGKVTLRIDVVTSGWNLDQKSLYAAETVLAFAVHDTGIGIPKDKQQVIFEAFQQVDGTTSRKYGGTGLGLSISRELATVLGGQIRLTSQVGQGSVFTLYLPQIYVESHDSAEAEQQISSVSESQQSLQSSASSTLTERLSLLDSPEPASTADAETDAVSVSLERLPSSLTRTAVALTDDRDNIQPNDRVLLIVEDDPNFARVLLDQGRKRGFRGLVASQGDQGLEMALQYKPDLIILDIQLPVLDGWQVLQSLKDNPTTRHIPVQIMSVAPENADLTALDKTFYLAKPVSLSVLAQAFDNISTLLPDYLQSSGQNQQLLVVEDNEIERNQILQTFEATNIQVTAVETASEALEYLNAHSVDCIVVDLMLPGQDGFTVIDIIRQELKLTDIPIIVYTAKDLNLGEQNFLSNIAESVIQKDNESVLTLQQDIDRILQKTRNFDNRLSVSNSELSPNSSNVSSKTSHSSTTTSKKEELSSIKPLEQVIDPPVDESVSDFSIAPSSSVKALSQSSLPVEVHPEEINSPDLNLLVGQQVLVVDDDVRNVFALTSILENYQMQVSYAENGRDALAILKELTDVKVILMDIMMPEMDGYETTQAIRKLSKFKSLPIIALTAKAMTGDREKCLEAGASDYISKPVDVDKLLSLLCKWLSS